MSDPQLLRLLILKYLRYFFFRFEEPKWGAPPPPIYPRWIIARCGRNPFGASEGVKKTNRKTTPKNNRQFSKKGSKIDPPKGPKSDSKRRPEKDRRPVLQRCFQRRETQPRRCKITMKIIAFYHVFCISRFSYQRHHPFENVFQNGPRRAQQ